MEPSCRDDIPCPEASVLHLEKLPNLMLRDYAVPWQLTDTSTTSHHDQKTVSKIDWLCCPKNYDCCQLGCLIPAILRDVLHQSGRTTMRFGRRNPVSQSKVPEILSFPFWLKCSTGHMIGRIMDIKEDGAGNEHCLF